MIGGPRSDRNPDAWAAQPERSLDPAEPRSERSLDPEDWEAARALGHLMVDDAIEYLRHVRERRTWSPIPRRVKETYTTPLPLEPTPVAEVYAEFHQTILPFPPGNIHPRFWSWVHGTGTFTGALADMMASVMNANCAIGEHSAMYIDRQVLGWCKTMMGFPAEAGGLLVSGGSMANFTALAVARERARERAAAARESAAAERAPGSAGKAPEGREAGSLVAYGSSETHQCVAKALKILGLENLAVIPVGDDYRIRLDLLRERIAADRAAGKVPFCIIGNAGTVNTGAIDDLGALRIIANEEGLWFHIDGAFGALARLVGRTDLEAVGDADSVAFDLHKWMYIPYEVGCVLIRDAEVQRRTFSTPAHYLVAHDRGLASGPDSYSNQGIELSRGFKALKVWMSIKEHGIKRYGEQIAQNIAQAAYLGELIKSCPELELMAEVTLNVVCFRFRADDSPTRDLDALNKELLMRLHESGVAAPSFTLLKGHYVIRVAITNHRTRMEDMRILVKTIIDISRDMI